MFSSLLRKNAFNLYRFSARPFAQPMFVSMNTRYFGTEKKASEQIKEGAEQIKEGVQKKYDEWADASKYAAGESKSWADSVKEKVKQDVKETAQSTAKDTYDTAKSYAQAAKEKVEDAARSATDARKDETFTEAAKHKLDDALHNPTVEGLTEKVKGWARAASDKIEEAVVGPDTKSKLRENVEKAEETAENLKQKGEELYESAKEKVQEVADKFKKNK